MRSLHIILQETSFKLGSAKVLQNSLSGGQLCSMALVLTPTSTGEAQLTFIPSFG